MTFDLLSPYFRRCRSNSGTFSLLPNMIYSMTGYAAQTLDTASGQLSLELRSVNSRFQDLNFRVTDELRGLEPVAREKIGAAVRRGKVECRLALTQGVSHAAPTLNAECIQNLKALEAEARVRFPDAAALKIIDILRWPGALTDKASEEPDALAAGFAALMEATLTEFNACRAREGEKLAAAILESAGKMRVLLREVAPHIPAAQKAQADRLRQRLEDALNASGVPVDENRILQEIALFAARIDVAEELTRLSTHLDELERIFKAGGAVGKRLDFLMQELNREANTLASKSGVTEVTNAALEMKLLIEQIREQVQNLE